MLMTNIKILLVYTPVSPLLVCSYDKDDKHDISMFVLHTAFVILGGKQCRGGGFLLGELCLGPSNKSLIASFNMLKNNKSFGKSMLTNLSPIH